MHKEKRRPLARTALQGGERRGYELALNAPALAIVAYSGTSTESSLSEMPLKVVSRLPPRADTPAMMATPTRAAIRPYSIAVAPCSSFRKRFRFMIIVVAPVSSAFHQPGRERRTRRPKPD